jgi:predicted double-glycine peptidase
MSARTVSLAAGLILAVATSLGARADFETDPKVQFPPGTLGLPMVRQQTGYSCGPASLLSVLKYWLAFDGAEQDLYHVLGTTKRNGTHPKRIAEGAKKFFLDAEFRTSLTIDDLRAAFGTGATVIVDYQAWGDYNPFPPKWANVWEDGHYSVVMGMDESNLFLMDPSVDDAYGYLPIAEFEERWHDYETEHGKRVEYSHEAIVIKGIRHTANGPDSQNLQRIH